MVYHGHSWYIISRNMRYQLKDEHDMITHTHTIMMKSGYGHFSFWNLNIPNETHMKTQKNP